jgi:hypothetical protein
MTTAIGAYATAAALKTRLGISDVTDDTVLGTVCDQVNAYIESFTGRVLAPVTSATYLLDVEEPCEKLHFPRGIRAISAISVGDYTGATRVSLGTGDYALRPAAHDRRPGWPATWLYLTGQPGAVRSYFSEGFDIVSMTATTGWDAIPDEITEVALTAATRAWHGIQAGQQDIVGTDEMGRPMVSRFFSARDLGTLRTYSVDIP